ncbi:cyclophilin-like protein [Epithele typhae]|uniref:cyclophilin-like protein n=1 Tax=Epithele typhae TaxID=378194 RepID=UPI0020079266|nr:cyclophilin-like protein [Epithele typhae]KAH9921730.1 cyclophilin-like protein [Epithele typhae]
MALPTRGRVIIETTVGEIDMELWSKETPKACRNFITLAMEGYYDGNIFHRVVPDFLVQTGDRTGTGGGGESFYGEPFDDEIHPRLRFVHRGLVGMANNGTKNSNDSQFFITLNRADELNGKHTLFARVIGDTFFNVLKIGEMELDGNERPLYPPKIKKIRIVDNPYEDIVPRITAEEKRAQQKAREQAQREREEEQRRRGAKKDVKLLSFGGDEEAEEEPVVFKKKPIVRPDLIDAADTAVPIPGVPAPAASKASKRDQPKDDADDPPRKKSSKRDKDESDITKIREQHEREKAAASTSRQSEIAKMEADIRRLTRRPGDGSDDDGPAAKKPKRSFLEEEMAKYAKGRGAHAKKRKGRKDEGDVLAALSSFRTKLKGATAEEGAPGEGEGEEGEEGEDKPAGGEEAGMEVDDDVGFLGHLLQFPKGNDEEVAKAERDYEVIDPRQRGARAKEEELERKRAQKARDVAGGRGYRR